jgi:hypothetical protein
MITPSDLEKKLVKKWGLALCPNAPDCGHTEPVSGRLADYPQAQPCDETAALARAYEFDHARRLNSDQNRQRHAMRAAAKPAETADWFKWYSESYLQSDGWRVRRKIVLMRDQHCCQMYLAGCTGTATEVHHRSYAGMREGDNNAHQPLCDLVAVCGPCHRAWTELERAGRVKVTPPRFA